MLSTLQDILAPKSVELENETFQWWNGHAYMEGQKVKAQYSLDNLEFQLTSTLLDNEFQRESSLSSATDFNGFQLVTQFPQVLPLYRITTNSRLERWLSKSYFNVDCKHRPYKKELLNSEWLLCLYALSFELTAFSPDISCLQRGDRTELSINFQLSSRELDALDKILELIENFARTSTQGGGIVSLP